jgi:hypothetical protein
MKQIQTKYDNFNFNKLLAYTYIIDSLNYKWYKSSKRRFLLPSFYFTRFFHCSLKKIFFKNVFRKNFQPIFNHTFINSINLFEKKMFLKNVLLVDFLKKSGSYFYFFKKKDITSLEDNKFFFKNFNYSNVPSGLFISKKLSIPTDVSIQTLSFHKKDHLNLVDFSFNFLIFFYIFNCCVVELYKMNILFYINK